MLLLIYGPGSKVYRYVLGAHGSSLGLARTVQEKVHCICIGALITSVVVSRGYDTCFSAKVCDAVEALCYLFCTSVPA